MKMNMVILAAATSCFVAGPLLAQDDQPPPFEKGPVWVFTEIKTKDGHFDDYMKFLDTKLKSQSEGLKAAGRLLDYKIFVVESPRQGEPDIMIGREYPNMAAFDHSTQEDFDLAHKIEGSITKADQAQAARGSIRDILGEVMMREVTLK